MYRRAMIGLISVLSCCALACVGFSAWSITTDDMFTSASSGTLSSEDVILSDEYVSIGKVDLSNFNVTPNGFANAEGKISYGGSFGVTFSADVGMCGTLASNNADKLRVEVTLRLANNAEVEGLFSTSTITFQSSESFVTISAPSCTSNSFTAKFTLDTTNLTESFNGTFSFTLNKTVYDALYPKLNVKSENSETKVTNPFTLVVAVSNEAA